MAKYIKLLRVHQYLKNLFIFAPLFFGLKLTDKSLIVQALTAFVSFSLVASSVYIFNDYHDVADDRQHPVKRFRPLASGEISSTSALVLMALLLAAGFALAAAAGLGVISLLLIYLLLNAGYTIKLKHVPILDVFIVASGFVIRLLVGSEVTGIVLSMWIMIMTFLLAVFLALAKRRDDVVIFHQTSQMPRKVIDGYNIQFLDVSMSIMASVIIVAYLMYSTSSTVIKHVGGHSMYITTVFVLLGILRYLQISMVMQVGGSPTEVLIRDRFIQLTIVGWILTSGYFLYF